jgi:hypothetical protein
MKRSWITLLPVCLAACAPLTRPAADLSVTHRLTVRHPGVHAAGPQSYTLREVRGASGFPAEYTMDVDSVICPEETCLISTVRMTWDALGRYQRYELPPGELLEKGVPAAQNQATIGSAAPWKGVPFAEADYRKLDAILRDDHSLLGQQQLAGLVRPRHADLVDGITGATPAALRDAVVEGASLTCYNLWHWANGEVAAAARELTHRQCGEAMLLSFLSSDKPHYILFALEHLRLHKLFGPRVVREVSAALRAGGRERIDLGLAYLREALPEADAFYGEVGALVNASAGEARIYLLDRLASESALPSTLFDTLSAGLPGWNNYYEVHLFLRLAEKRGHVTPRLLAQVARLLENPNFFIARRAHAFLGSQPELDAQTAGRLQAFRDKAARDGRSL